MNIKWEAGRRSFSILAGRGESQSVAPFGRDGLQAAMLRRFAVPSYCKTVRSISGIVIRGARRHPKQICSATAAFLERFLLRVSNFLRPPIDTPQMGIPTS